MRFPQQQPFALACFAACLALTTAAQEKADAVTAPSANAPRGKLLEWKSAQGQPYWYRLPKAIDQKNPPDLVFMLHGTGLDHRWGFWNFPILEDFRKRDIVVSPDGVAPGQGGTFNFLQGPKDGEQITGLIADFKKQFPIGRVYLYGHSQGAFFCYWYAGEHPELIDGIVAHAGNVLDVKHGKLAKQKVAIVILHGRADAVVPVECALRTEKIYREEGYEKLKLEIVEGLTEKSGHWPLPSHTAKMFDWLDQMSTQSAAQAVRIVMSELRRANPDLAAITEQVQKAKKLLAKADDADKKHLAEQLAALTAFLDQAMRAHSEKLLAEPGVSDPKATFGAWVPHFLSADRAFGEQAEWRKALGKPRELAGRHDKVVDKAMKALDRGSKGSWAAGLRGYEEAILSGRSEELRVALLAALKDSKPPEPDGEQRLAALVAARTEASKQADKAMGELVAPLLKELEAVAPSLFEVETTAEPGK